MAGLLSQNLYRIRFLNPSRLNYFYSALFHRSPYLNAAIFDFGDGDDDDDDESTSKSLLNSLCEVQGNLASLYCEDSDSNGSITTQVNVSENVATNILSVSELGFKWELDSMSADLEGSCEALESTSGKPHVSGSIGVSNEISAASFENNFKIDSEHLLDSLEALKADSVSKDFVFDNTKLTTQKPDLILEVSKNLDLGNTKSIMDGSDIAFDDALVSDKQDSKGDGLVTGSEVSSGTHLQELPPETVDIPAPVGHLEPQPTDDQVPEDTKDVKIGTLIALMVPEGEDWQSVTVPASEDSPPPQQAAESAAAPVVASPPVTAPAGADAHAHGNYGPSVRLLLEQYGLTAGEVPHGGPHGILVKGDVLKLIREKNLSPKPLAVVPPPVAPKSSAPVAAPPPGPAPKAIPGVSEDGYEDIEITNIRRVIARRLTQSKSGIAHSYGTFECKSDELIMLRKQYKQEGINVSINDIIIKAVAIALMACPEMNCVWQGDQLVMSNEVDISVAVATPAGLITPIIRGADSIGIEEIASRVRDLAGRARENKLKPEEFQGGTFTISNLGMFGISEFSAIINPPQCGILAVGGSRLLCDESGQPVTYMSGTLSYDRAGIDDDLAAHFLSTLKGLLENPSTMILGSQSAVNHPLAALL